MAEIRVTQQQLFSPILDGVQRSTSRIQELRGSISTGKRVQKPSDDPLATRSILDFKDKLQDLEQYASNLVDSRALITQELAEVENLQEEMTQVREALIQAGNASFGAEERMALGDNVDKILQNVIQGANTKFLGKFIFGGGKTQTPPFEQVLDNAGNITAVSYKGDGKDIKYQIGTGINLAVNKPGSEVYIDSRIFSTLINVRDALMNNDTVAIQSQLATMDVVESDLFSSIGEFGTKLNQISLSEERNDKTKLRLEELRSANEDADIAELLTDLQVEETVLQAALASGTRVTRLSLLNFL